MMIENIRNAIVFFLFTLLFIQGCKNEEKIEGPSIRFESDTCNIGEVGRGESVSNILFSFFNPGSDTLVLESVRSSCSSCTIIDEYDERVAPGGSGKISATYKAKGGPRHISVQIFVRTNISDDHKIILTVTGNRVETVAKIQVIPRAIRLGEIDSRNTSLNGRVRLKSSFDKPLLITDIVPPNEKTKIKVDTLEEGKNYIINIAVRPPFKKGDHGEEVILKTSLKERPVIIVPYVYSFNPPKGFKEIIKDKFSKISLICSFFGKKVDVERRLRELKRSEEMAAKIEEPLRSGKGGTEYIAMRDEFYGLMHERANMAMKFLTEFAPADLNKNDLISLLEIAKVAEDEQQLFNISKILFEKFPEYKSDLNLMKNFFMNSCLFEPGEVVKYVNMDMFTTMDQLWMYYMLALGFSEWGSAEEAMNYTEKAENVLRMISSDKSKMDSIPVLQIATVRALVLKKVGNNEGAYKVVEYAREKLSDNNDAVQQLGSIERRLNVLDKKAPPLGTQYWSGTEKPLKLLDLKGKVILIVFSDWDSEECNIDLPYLFRLQREVNNDDFIIIGAFKYINNKSELSGLDISTWQEYEQMIDDYRKARGINWPISVSKVSFYDYGVIHTPDYILIDKKGIVKDGYFIRNYSYLKNKILRLLAES